MNVPAGDYKTHGIKRYFSDHGIVGNHHGNCPEEHFQVIRKFLPSCVPKNITRYHHFVNYFSKRSYPGFIVMNMLHVGFSLRSVPSKLKTSSLLMIAIWMHSTCWAITERTSRSIRLNSSKQAQAPEQAKPCFQNRLSELNFN